MYDIIPITVVLLIVCVAWYSIYMIYRAFNPIKIKELNYSYEDWEKILCRIHDRMWDGAITIHEIIEGLDIKNPVGKYNFLYSQWYVRKWTFHSTPKNELNRTYLITDKGIRMAEELKWFAWTDGFAKYWEHE